MPLRYKPNIVNWYDYGNANDPLYDPAFHHYHILAEGDSWFTLGGVPSTNLLHSLRFERSTLIATCARPGDTIRHMSEIAHTHAYGEALSPRHGEKWDMILLSAGGNDFIDDAGKIIRNSPTPSHNPADYCNQQQLQCVIDDIQRGYTHMVSVRDQQNGPARGKPIVVHTYDYPTPRNSPARFFGVATPLGPWLYPALLNAGVPQAMWVKIADYLFERLAHAIGEMQQRLPNFFVVRTHGTLARAQLGDVDNNADWQNEIHPNLKGYRKLGDKLSVAIQPLLS